MVSKKKNLYDFYNSTEVYAAFSFLLGNKVTNKFSLADLGDLLKKAKNTISEQISQLKDIGILKEVKEGKRVLLYFNKEYLSSKSGKKGFPCLSQLSEDMRLSILKGSLSFAHAETSAAVIIIIKKMKKKHNIEDIVAFYDMMYLAKMYGKVTDVYDKLEMD